MGLLRNLFAGSAKKLAPRLKQLDKLLATDKLDEAASALNELITDLPDDVDKDDLELVNDYRGQLFKGYLGAERYGDAVKLAVEIVENDPSKAADLAQDLIGQDQIDKRVQELVLTAIDHKKDNKRLMLTLAKLILKTKDDALDNEDISFISNTAKHFPLWKDGVGILADMFLKESRRDEEALVVYRNAYPNRKADRKLREVLLESLIINNENDEFAASVYKDTVETSDNPQALRLLSEYHIGQGDFSTATAPYIIRALEKTQFSPGSLKKLADLINETEGNFFNKTDMLLAIYRQGYHNRDMLTFLGEALAEANRFDNESIEIMTRAFEQRVVSKRAILILAEHCLANEREDEFALGVYESYLSTWPDRPQRKIYSILAHRYAELTRVDEQAQKIYEEALEDSPTDTIVLTILARAYHAMDRRDEAADEVYRHTFPLASEEIKVQLARILAEMRLEANAYTEETLQYLTVMGRPDSGPLKNSYDEALTSCFLSTGRRGEQAQSAYIELFKRTEHSENLNSKLVEMLAELIKEQGKELDHGSLEMRVYRKLFELKKFSTDPDVSFVLLNDALKNSAEGINLIHLAVRCFEADEEKLLETLKSNDAQNMLQDIGDFYIEHFSFPLAARAYKACFEISPTDAIRYRLVKIQLLDGDPEPALKHLGELNAMDFADKRKYWEAAAYQMLNDPGRAADLLHQISSSPDIPQYLLRLRGAINLELTGDMEGALEVYDKLVVTTELHQFMRWLQLQRGIVRIKLGDLETAHAHLEEIHRQNPNSRAEQLFLSLAKFFIAHRSLRDGDLNKSLPLFASAVEVNRNDRLLRQVIVEILCLYGEKAFFENHLERAARILEVAHRILPKRIETKIFLAYTYHRMKDYAKAIIYYRDITWTDDNPRLERSQAYAYMANKQPDKAWRVFLDLARRNNLLAENFPRLVSCFLGDPDAADGKAWDPIEFPDGVNTIQLTALMMHDGLYNRAIQVINNLIKKDADNPQLFWYLGRAYSKLEKRDLAVHNWKELLKLCEQAKSSNDLKIKQYTEIGLAFVESGYAQEAMQTWEKLREIDPKNTDLPALYAATLDLNAYQLARKDQLKLAREEWKKALKYDVNNASIQQNYAIINLLVDNYEEATREFHKLGNTWLSMAKENPKAYGRLHGLVGSLERAMNTLALTKGRDAHDITKAKAEMAIDDFQKANQFYWILGLTKNATQAQIEREYFRLIKIFNPERHADDFMLVEESYTYLIRNPEKRPTIDLFVFNPTNVAEVRQRLRHINREGKISFEQLSLPASIPAPDYQQLEPTKKNDSDLAAPLVDLLAINLKIPDWMIV